MKRKAIVCILFFVFIVLLLPAQSRPVNGKEKAEKDPYFQVSKELESLANSLGSIPVNKRANSVAQNNNYANSSSDDIEKNSQTDFLFKSFKAWRELFLMEDIRSTVNKKLEVLTNLKAVSVLGTRNFFPTLVLLMFILETAFLFYSGELSLDRFIKTTLYVIFIFVVILKYETIFAGIDKGFKELTAYLVKSNPKAWDDATTALFIPLFSYGGFFPPAAVLQGLMSVFLIIPLYFVYYPAITLPPLVAELLILGLYLIGKFALALSVLSTFRHIAKNFLLSIITLELYVFVFAILTLAVGLSVRKGLIHFVTGQGNILKAVFGWNSIEALLFIGPLTALFVALDILSYNVVRGVLSGFFTSSGFGRVTAATGTLGVSAGKGAVKTVTSAAGMGIKGGAAIGFKGGGEIIAGGSSSGGKANMPSSSSKDKSKEGSSPSGPSPSGGSGGVGKEGGGSNPSDSTLNPSPAGDAGGGNTEKRDPETGAAPSEGEDNEKPASNKKDSSGEV